MIKIECVLTHQSTSKTCLIFQTIPCAQEFWKLWHESEASIAINRGPRICQTEAPGGEATLAKIIHPISDRAGLKSQATCLLGGHFFQIPYELHNSI